MKCQMKSKREAAKKEKVKCIKNVEMGKKKKTMWKWELRSACAWGSGHVSHGKEWLLSMYISEMKNKTIPSEPRISVSIENCVVRY